MKVKLVADSQNFTQDRLSTFEIELPTRSLLRLASHRMLSVSVLPPPPLFIDWVLRHPDVGFVPADVVHIARQCAPENAPILLAPWSFSHVLVSATEWEHFLAYGPMNPDLVGMIGHALQHATPRLLREGEWHLPYVVLDDSSHLDFVPPEGRDNLLQISVDRCARSANAYAELIRARDFSWFEHQAQALDQNARVGNFIGWRQHRKLFSDEWKGRKIEAPFLGSAYTPFYARMEAAFRRLLLNATEADRAAITERHLLGEFFPRDAEKLPPLSDDDDTLVP